MTRRTGLIIAGAVALVLLLLVVRTARGQKPAAAKLGPPRYVGAYDRLPDLEAEIVQRARAVAIARRILAQQPPSAPNIVADMQAILDANLPKLDQLRAAVEDIRRAGQA